MTLRIKQKKKKTLSLKLGIKPPISPKRNIEAGKTVIVEKKRYKKVIILSPKFKNQIQKVINPTEKKPLENNNKHSQDRKSGVLLKPLSKDEQKRILKADSKNEKKS